MLARLSVYLLQTSSATQQTSETFSETDKNTIHTQDTLTADLCKIVYNGCQFLIATYLKTPTLIG
jgi:hypothetical protein